MARCLQSAQEFILNSFPAFVGALASEDAESICQKNNLSFVELVRPFCQLDGTVTIRDPVNPNIVIQVKNFKIRIIDIQAPLPPKILVNRVLNEVVNRSIPGVDLKSKQSLEQLKTSSTHWYDAYRDCFFQLLHPMRHEFIRDYLACVMIVSTKHPDPMHAFAALSSKQNSMQHSSDSSKSFQWFGNNTFKYFLLLHDVSDGEDKKAEAVFQSMKSVYGSHTCFLLQINSRSKVYPNASNEKMSFSDPWSQHIYPFSDETLDIDENEFEKVENQEVFTNQKDADKREAKIVDELETIEKEIEENNKSPRSLSFNDPLTSMHYNEVLDNDEGDFTEAMKQQKEVHSNRPRKLSERTLKLQEYKKSLQQFSYAMVTQVGSVSTRKERGQQMTLMDQDKIKAFVYEFAVRGLLPHIEKLMRNISEQIIARKGIHKSLFHATKKWFGGNKPSPTAIGTGMVTSSSYNNDSLELQHRKLGDLAFLIQHYELAYSSYHSAKREFNNEHAWMYFAGALEMAAISSFMLGTSQMYPVHYFEACISTYLKTCRMPDYATRACLMSTEALKSKAMYPEAAVEFIRLTNEDCDLRSALLLEQAAHCYLHNRASMVRKYAFHMILAGHRYSKSSQKKHTLRCYINALQVYQKKGWDLAEDHVKFIIGRQSFNLGNLLDSQESLKYLLTYESQQPPSQQASYLREYLAVFKQNLTSAKDMDNLPDLPLPNILCQSTRCLVYLKETPYPITISNITRTRTVYAGAYTFQKNFSKNYVKRWAELEKQVLLHVTGNLPYPFKPYTPCLSTFTNNKSNPIVSAGEPFAYEIHFQNPLKIPLNLLDLMLLWELEVEDENQTCISNKTSMHEDYIYTEVIENFHIKPAETKAVCLRLKSFVPGKLKLIAVKYILSSTAVTGPVDDFGKVEESMNQDSALRNVGVPGKQLFSVKGPRLNSTKQEKRSVVYDIDKRLEPHILPALPLLEVKLEDIPSTLLCGEIKSCQFIFKNVGHQSMKNIYLISNKLDYFSFDKLINKTCKQSNSNSIVNFPLEDNQLKPNEELTVPVNILGLDKPGVHEIEFLFYYEPTEVVKRVPYRLIQQMIRIQTLSTLNVSSYLHSMTEQSDLTDDEENIQRMDMLNNTVLSLCIENKSQGSSTNLRCVEFSLKSLKTFTRCWNIETLVQLPTGANMLRPDEICMLHLKLTRADQSKDELLSSIIELSDNSNEQKHEVETVSDSLFLRSEENLSKINDSFGLILCWETFYIDETFSRNVIRGQTHILPTFRSSNITRDISITNETDNQTNPKNNANEEEVTISLTYPAFNENNFKTSSVCSIPINITCSNKTNHKIEFFVEMDDKSTENVTWKRSLQWSGYLNKSTAIEGKKESTVQINALATSVGIYSLQNLSAYYTCDDEGESNEKSFLYIDPSLFLSVWDNCDL